MLISKSAFARKMGVSPAAVGKACKSGRLTPIGGWLDEAVATLQWDLNRQRLPPVGASPSRPKSGLGGKFCTDHPPADDDVDWEIENTAVWITMTANPAGLPHLVDYWLELATARRADPALASRLVELLQEIARCVDRMSHPEPADEDQQEPHLHIVML